MPKTIQPSDVRREKKRSKVGSSTAISFQAGRQEETGSHGYIDDRQAEPEAANLRSKTKPGASRESGCDEAEFGDEDHPMRKRRYSV